ncbi:toxin-antitoxin system YwqK family antitoxin [Enterovibrio sp. FF113]|uniref:toxin-antitoxin system YwqK family antitoxin n=1 Tax=Enterovibrio sp. FF113 TaxID=3230010 RepID=UPI00352F2C46
MRFFTLFTLMICSLLMTSSAFAERILLDASLKLVTGDKKAKYYMTDPLTEQDEKWPAVVYFVEYDTVYFKGGFNAKEPAKANVVGDYEYYTWQGVIKFKGHKNSEGKEHGLKQTYSSGDLKKEQHYVNGVLNGPQKVFYSNGHVSEEFEMLDGKQTGESISYQHDGSVRSLTTWLDGETHGPMFNYYPNGNINYEMNFQHGQRHGKYRAYYFDGQLKSEGQSAFSQYEGVFNRYDKAGNKIQQQNYKDNVEHGVTLNWYANGQLSSKQHFVAGELHGASTEYDEAGNTAKIFNYANGKEVGEQRVFHKQSDMVEVIYEYNDDSRLIAKKEFNKQGEKLFDLSVSFNENHERISDEFRYRHGVVISRRQEDESKAWKQTEFFDEGELTHRTETIDGEYHNLYFTQLVDHKARKQHYKHGVPHGKFSVTQFGEIIEQGEYFEGAKYGYWEHDWDGKRVFNYNKKGEYHGEVKKYYRLGGVDRLDTYANGIQHGPSESYMEDGTLWSKGNFVDGKEEGKWQTIIPRKSKTAMWTGFYRSGEKVGMWTGQYPDGTDAGEVMFDK